MIHHNINCNIEYILKSWYVNDVLFRTETGNITSHNVFTFLNVVTNVSAFINEKDQ